MDTHEIANIIPSMSDTEYQELKADMAANGQIEPIRIYEGKILDGRHRFKACLEMGMKPKLETVNPESPISYVISLNEKRRHLTSSQRAALAVRVESLLAAEAKERQRAAGGDRKSGEYRQSVTQKIAEPIIDEPTKSTPQAG